MIKEQLQKLLDQYSHPQWLKADRRLSEPLIKAFLDKGKQVDGDEVDRKRFIVFISHSINEQLQAVYDLRRNHSAFIKRHSHAIADRERHQYILDYAKYLGASAADLDADKEAFNRWLGADTMTDRYMRRHLLSERKITLYLRYLGHLVALELQESGESLGHSVLWRHLNLESMVKPLLVYDGDSRVNIEAFHCLSTALKVLPRNLQQEVVSSSTTQYIYRSALESRQQVWIQCEALNLLQSLYPESFYIVVEKRLSRPLEGDDLFIRRRAVQLLGENLQHLPKLAQLFPVIANDPSPFVRQGFAGTLQYVKNEDVIHWLRQLVIHDESPQVRAAALLQFVNHLQSAILFQPLLQIMIDVLAKEQDSYVIRVALKVVGDGQEKLTPEHGTRWVNELQPSLAQLHTEAENLSVRRWAAQTREKLWLVSQPAINALASQLQQEIQNISPGEDSPLPKQLCSTDEATLGRVLSVLGQQDFGYDVKQGMFKSHTVTRGHRFGFRLWRFIYELRHPAPDKRQAFEHTIGRLFNGNLRAPSSIMSELAQTKVPGEPLFIPTEGGWRPYLPLVDEVVSSLDLKKNKTVRFYSSEGVTELTPPKSIVQRMKARAVLVLKFDEFARLRNWQENHQVEPSHYIQSLKKLGFDVTFAAHKNDDAVLSEDPAVRRFFPAIVFVPMPDLWQKIQDYFFSAYENSLFELAIFTAAAILIFSGKHLYKNHRIKKTRENLPLVIGGWGTRGKSGTERIKAAMLNALGYGVVSKTTGCEAMFLYADPYGRMHEMFLFRPYDKATIWEQFDVMQHAVELEADIFLWECMALTPSYVKILQQHWVRDDISTITNAYPDHEDIQGPAGVNIPQVMANFIPKSGVLLTTEEQMRPILAHAAAEQNTRITGVGWLESGLLTPDILARFPYEEHPDNIALVLQLAEELGIAPDFALKEMADRVVADLGVLKTFPVANLKTRQLQFTNGMSANERFGCLSNWSRMAFDKQNYEEEPGVWVTAIVNNRADRIARSRVFANILVADISADRYFLIGSNLAGLTGYIQEAWQSYAMRLTLWPETQKGVEAISAEQVLQQFAQHYRIAYKSELVVARLRVMLEAQTLLSSEVVEDICRLWKSPLQIRKKLDSMGVGEDLESIMTHHELHIEELASYEALTEKLQKEDNHTTLNENFRALLHQWFNKKIIVIEDVHSTGDATIKHIIDATPPGYLNRIMGMQNIKGTGLDFVYRWQAWNTCYVACTQLRSNDRALIEQGLRTLAGFRDYGLLCEAYMRETIELAKQNPHIQRESAQAELVMISSNLELAMRQVHKNMAAKRQVGLGAKLIGLLEAFLDAGDAVKRRKTADVIYKDLVSERISIGRAIQELQALN
ncbi:MAG: HEAT repeat domain-containing protein, partial [Nitrosomonas sp.]|nr:HEAT repeat domain-containing protein [Nitrosomonas sp.]